jgi:hypothetical protein
VERTFDLLQQVRDAVEREARSQVAEVACGDFEGALGGRAAGRETAPQRLVDDLPERPSRTAHLRAELPGHVLVERQRGPHIKMLVSTHHDVNWAEREWLTVRHPLFEEAHFNMEGAPARRRLGWAPGATSSTALLVWFGTGLNPWWPLLWLAPLPVLLLATRSGARVTALAAALGWLLGSLNLLHYFHTVLQIPTVGRATTRALGSCRPVAPSVTLGGEVLLMKASTALLVAGASIALLFAVGCGGSQKKDDTGSATARIVSDTRVVKEAEAAANEVVRSVGDCDAVKAAYPNAIAKLDAADAEAQTQTGRTTLETLRKQVKTAGEACGLR